MPDYEISKTVIAFAGTLLLSLLLTPLIRYTAQKFNKVESIKDDRWHRNPVPLFGGIAMWFSWSVVVFYLFHSNQSILIPLAGALMIFLLGLFDDLFHFNPLMKLIGQIIIAAIVVKMGIVFKITPYPLINIPLTILWIIAITNAFNLLDNMDGLSSGVAVIASFSMYLISLQSGDTVVSLLSIALAGAALGFLKYNFYPAKIFMGDCGSMFLGFSLAIISIVGTWQHASNLLITMIVPLLVLGVPIFDTLFVSITRKLRGTSISSGGIDHISHRLVALGMSQERAVLTLYVFSTFLGGIAVYHNKLNTFIVLIGLALIVISLFCFGLFLGEMEVYAKDNRFKKKFENTVELGHHKKYSGGISKRRVAEIIMDLILIAVSFVSSYLIRFEGNIPTVQMYNNMVNILPWVIAVKLSFLYLLGVYRSIWKYIGMQDVLDIIKALIASALIVALFIQFKFQFIDCSKSTLIIDLMLSILLLCGFRFSIRAFRDQIRGFVTDGKKALIIGAGDTGVLLLKEIHNNPEIDYKVAGFLDDNPVLQNMRINGVAVLGNIDYLPIISKEKDIKEILIAIPSADDETINRIIRICENSNLEYKTFHTIIDILEKK